MFVMSLKTLYVAKIKYYKQKLRKKQSDAKLVANMQKNYFLRVENTQLKLY